MKKRINTVIGILICFLLFIFLFTTKHSFPEKILIQVFDLEDKVELNANCRADFFDESKRTIEDRQLINLKNGNYQLDTSELKYYKDYEIRIVCILPKNRGVGGLIINKNNIPCERKEDYLVCSM